MIERINMQNWRGIQSASLSGLRKFNVLIGPNNCGKTAVLEALYLASGVGKEGGLIVDGQSWPVLLGQEDLLGDFPLLRVLRRHHYKDAHSERLRYEQGTLKVHLPDSVPLPDFDLVAAQADGTALDSGGAHRALFALSREAAGDVEEQTRVVELARRLITQPAESLADRRVLCCFYPELTHYGCGWATCLLTGRPAAAGHCLFYDTHDTMGHLPGSFYRRSLTKVPGWMHTLAPSLRVVADLPESSAVTFLPLPHDEGYFQALILQQNQVALTIDSYGDGTRTALKILARLLSLTSQVRPEAEGLFLWEEPELFQNPLMLRRLLREVVRLVKDQPVQLVLATHSLEVMADFVAMTREGHLDPREFAAVRLNLHRGELRSSLFSAEDVVAYSRMKLDVRVPSGETSPLWDWLAASGAEDGSSD